MSKRVRAVLTLVQIIACAVASYSQSVVRLEPRQLNEHGVGWSVDIKYPFLEGHNTFNNAIREQVNATADVFREKPSDATSSGQLGRESYVKGKYTAEILNSGVISVLFDYEESASTAVHPWGVMASINYDTRSRRLLALSDLFRPRSNYVSRLSKISIHKLDQHEYAVKSTVRHGAGPVEKNFQVFTLTDTALVLHFQQYQVAAGAMPPEAVSIPLIKLAELLRKEHFAGQ